LVKCGSGGFPDKYLSFSRKIATTKKLQVSGPTITGNVLSFSQKMIFIPCYLLFGGFPFEDQEKKASSNIFHLPKCKSVNKIIKNIHQTTSQNYFGENEGTTFAVLRQ